MKLVIFLRPKKQDGALHKVFKLESDLHLPLSIYVPSNDGSYANWYLSLKNAEGNQSIEVGISYSKQKTRLLPGDGLLSCGKTA